MTYFKRLGELIALPFICIFLGAMIGWGLFKDALNDTRNGRPLF